MIALVVRSFKDFLHPKILLLSLVPFVLASIFLGILFYLIHTQIAGFFPLIASYIPFVSAQWVQGISESFLGAFIFYEFWVMLALVFVGLISDKVVDTINNKYYHLEKKGFGSMTGSIFCALKSNTLFLLLFIITSPLLLIPGMNIFLHVLLWMVMLKAPMYYDACAFYATKEEFEMIKKKHKSELRLITFLSACLLLIPFVGVFLYVLELIMYTHFSLSKLKEA
jgi:hypothetical protein